MGLCALPHQFPTLHGTEPWPESWGAASTHLCCAEGWATLLCLRASPLVLKDVVREVGRRHTLYTPDPGHPRGAFVGLNFQVFLLQKAYLTVYPETPSLG